ncbi:UNKNOWN [Stylonychia lemnae]|uniref:Uncharacterized protein n=1 Tax=Stylonychia lemnae TaxID=5949 RepID=A0A078AJN6_STYLE|nr:UNKNOWN [Stylonychia lemnae]|eukprot:CDW82379.1 UNKNOWN [Stylonychia lemnae]
MEAQALQFQKLALILVQTVKSLQNYSRSLEELNDQDLEKRLIAVMDIIGLKFTMPNNITVSIIKILVSILINKIDSKKDFLIFRVLDIVESMLGHVDTEIIQAVETDMFDYIKWCMVLIRTEQPLEIAERSLTSMKLICQKMRQQSLYDIIPGVSSVVTKSLGGNHKSNQKVKIKLLEIWELILVPYFQSLKND